MNRNLFLYFLIFTMAGILFACSNTAENSKAVSDEIPSANIGTEKKEELKKLKTRVKELETQIEAHQLNLQQMKEETAYYLQFAKSAISYLSEEELLDLAKKQWKYTISINKTQIPANGKIIVDSDTVEILVSERQMAYRVLPNEILAQGRINGDFRKHIKEIKPEPNKAFDTDGTIVTGKVYNFSGMESGSVITLSISNEMRERVHLKTDHIKINIK